VRIGPQTCGQEERIVKMVKCGRIEDFLQAENVGIDRRDDLGRQFPVDDVQPRSSGDPASRSRAPSSLGPPVSCRNLMF
jgi:hypothetical protein